MTRLIDSALFVDSLTPQDFRNEADQTPEERARGDAWRRFRDRRPAVLVSTAGKSIAEIVADAAAAMREAGLLASDEPGCDIKDSESRASRKARPARRPKSR